MSANIIKKSLSVGTVVLKNKAEIVCEVAIETTKWIRPDHVAKTHGAALMEAAEQSTKPLPPGTAKLVSREGDHTSAGDPKDHITAVAYDKNGNRIETIHLDTPRK